MACGESSFAYCIYNLPICGGFCAPTESPESSCLRHVSNEYTVPGAPRYMTAAPCIETSACCMACGGTGCKFFEKFRPAIGVVGCGLNFVALVLTIIAAFGLTTSSSLIRSTHWVKGEAVFEGIQVNIYVGQSLRSDQLDCGESTDKARCLQVAAGGAFTEQDGDVYIRNFDWADGAACAPQFPDAPVSGAEDSIRAMCEACKNALLSKTTLIMSIVGQLPTMMTNLQRSTRFGDVNCQATMGIVSNGVSFVMSLTSLMTFRSGCYDERTTSFGGVEINWDIGVSFRCLTVATCIKIFDLLLHLVLPTPKARQSKPPASVTTLKDYMMLAYDYDAPQDGTTYGKTADTTKE